jgi:hypothetical protein
MISPIDHLPNVVIGLILKGNFAILSSFHSKNLSASDFSIFRLFCPCFLIIVSYFVAQRVIQGLWILTPGAPHVKLTAWRSGSKSYFIHSDD